MSLEIIILILMPLISWVYVVIALLNGKKITKEIKTSNGVALIVVFGVFAILIMIKNHHAIGIVSAIMVFLAGFMYSCIPTGFNDTAVYVKGKEYPYKIISEMTIENQNGKAMLTFKYRRSYHMVLTDMENKEMLKELKSTYSKEKRK